MSFGHSTLIITAIWATYSPHLVVANLASSGWQERQQQASVGEWFTLSPHRAPFSVTLPAMPDENAKELEPPIKVRTYPLKALTSEYLVVWATGLPVGSSDRVLLDSFFPLALRQVSKLAAARGGRFEEQYEKELILNGNCGRESGMRTWPPNSHEIRARGYIVGSDFVAFVVLYPKQEEASGEAERFFDSLTLMRTGTVIGLLDEPGSGSYADTDGADSDPAPLSPPRPGYTETAKANKVQGPVRLRVLVNRNGEVSEIWLVSHLPDGLDQEAIKSVRGLKFKPATKGREPVPGWVSMVVDFRFTRDVVAS